MQLPATDKILRLPDVKAITGLSTSTIYAWMRVGKFPQRFTLGNRSVGWKQGDIAAWIESRTSAVEVANV